MTRQMTHTVDIGIALSALADVVRDGGVDYVYRPVWMDLERYSTCLYAHNGRPDCIVGAVLARLGVAVEELEAMRDEGVWELYESGNLPLRMTLGAVAVLHSAQSAQDRGSSWGEVLATAGRTAAAFFDLMPDAVIQRVCDGDR